MTLKYQTVAVAYLEFAERFGWPRHADTKAKQKRVVEIDYRELARIYTEETFGRALCVAWQQARKFPCIADFHRGFDAPMRGPTMEELN